MNTTIELTQKQKTFDNEGFSTIADVPLITVRAYREGRHGSEKWANRSTFTDATDCFRFRAIPDFQVNVSMVLICEGRRYEIISVEDVKGRGMYIEVLAKEVVPGG